MIIWGGFFHTDSGAEGYLGYQDGYKYHCVPN